MYDSYVEIEYVATSFSPTGTDLALKLLIQYPHVSLFSTVITNEFVGEHFYLSQHSMDGYEAMGFDVTRLTQYMKQSFLQ